MSDTDGWFAAGNRDDLDAMATAVRTGSADEPRNWPALAVEAGFASDEDEYYDALREATTAATRAAATERERADDRQLVHAIRAMDDCNRTANELAERLAEWAGTVDPEAGTGVEYARELARGGPDDSDNSDDPGGTGGTGDTGDTGDTLEQPAVRSLARRVAGLADEADELRAFVERQTPDVAPNLSALAEPVLAARLIALAGGLEDLAKKPSGTIQVLGAEDALFAHLRGHAPSPKHGIIYTHDAVRGTHPENRGSAARAVAGKLAIAARVDHYSGESKPELEAELAERIETIQARTVDDAGGDDDATDGGADDE